MFLYNDATKSIEEESKKSNTNQENIVIQQQYNKTQRG